MHVLDQTMLLTKADYQKFVIVSKEKTGKLLVYMLWMPIMANRVWWTQ